MRGDVLAIVKSSRRRLTASLTAALAVFIGLGVAAVAQSQSLDGRVFLPGASNGPMGNAGQPTAPPHPTQPAHPTATPAHHTATPPHAAPECDCPWPPEKYPLDDVVMSLERTPCFGACPEYLVQVYGDGRVVYVGRRFVAVEGRQEATIGRADVESLVEAYYEARFFDLQPRYDARIYPCFRPTGEVEACSQVVTDLPSQLVTFGTGAYSKTVDDYWDPPESLQLLELKIDEVAGTEKWVRGPTPTP